MHRAGNTVESWRPQVRPPLPDRTELLDQIASMGGWAGKISQMLSRGGGRASQDECDRSVASQSRGRSPSHRERLRLPRVSVLLPYKGRPPAALTTMVGPAIRHELVRPRRSAGWTKQSGNWLAGENQVKFDSIKLRWHRSRSIALNPFCVAACPPERYGYPDGPPESAECKAQFCPDRVGNAVTIADDENHGRICVAAKPPRSMRYAWARP